MAPSPAAGKTGGNPPTPTRQGGPRTPKKLGQSAGPKKLGTPKAAQVSKPETDSPQLPPRPETEDVSGKPEEATEDLPEEPSKVELKDDENDGDDEGLTGKVSQAGEGASSNDLTEEEPKPLDEGEDTVAGAQEDVEGEGEAEDDEDDATQKAGDEADDLEESAGEQGDQVGSLGGGAQRSGTGLLGGAKSLAGRASSLAGKTSQDPTNLPEDAQEEAGGALDDAQDTAGEATSGVQDTAGDAVSGVKDTAEDATGQEFPGVPDLSILKGLEVQEDGSILDNDGNAVGRLVEGDAEDLVGYTIGDEGEILDEDGDLVGRCELTPEAAKKLTDEAQEGVEDAVDEAGAKLPGLEILKGLHCDRTGQILNEDGDVIGQITEGDPTELTDYELNEFGEILDEDGDVIGRAKVLPEAADLPQYQDAIEDAGEAAGETTEGLPEGATGVAGEAGDVVSGVKEGAEGLEPELPGVEALEGQEINSQGEILDDEGNVLGKIADGDIDKMKGLTVNEKGEVVDADGNVLGTVELAEGAAERLAEAAGPLPLDLRILEGLKVNKKGKVLDEEGEEIGQLTEGDPKDCAGKIINGKGEVLDSKGKAIGKVEVVPGEAANDALKALQEKLGEGPKMFMPGLEILDGMKVNKKGQIINEDGDPIGELVDGDLATCAGKKVNDKGEVLDDEGNVIGRVKTLPQEAEAGEEGAEAAEEQLDGAAEDTETAVDLDLPPLNILEGLTVNKSGKLVNSDGVVVGELIEGDAKKLSKSGVTCDDQGQFWDNKGHVIGRAQTVPVEEADEEAPFAGLEGLIVVKDGWVEDENGNKVGLVVEGDAKKLVGRAVDEDGDIIDKKGSVVGHAERYEEPDVEEVALDLSSLAGLTVNKQGMVIGDEGVPIGRLIEGNPKELAGRKIDGEGQIWNDQGQVIGRVELIPEEEREVKPEGPFAGLQDLRVIEGGKVADEDGNIVGEIVEGNPKRLIGLAVDEDGDIIDKYGNVKGHADPLPEEEEEVIDLSILEGKTLNKQGLLVDENGIPIGRLVEGDAKELAGRKSDGEGQIHNDTGKVVGRCELIPENQRVAKPEGPFAGLEGLRVVKDGFVEDEDGNRVGVLVEGNPKRLVGNAVDEDGDIIDKYGNVKGHAEPYEEPEEEAVDLSALAGCTVNKAGNVVDANGTILGRVAEGDPKTMIGKKVDGEGQIWDNAGNVIGRAELVQGQDTAAEGPFAGFDNLVIDKEGMVVTPSGDIVGRVIEGDIQKLEGHTVDEDGEVQDKNGNLIGRCERWRPEEKERRINPMSGMRVNKDGEVRDENGDLIGRLTAGDLGHCAGLEIDDNGYVVDNDGNKVGEVTLLENIVEEEDEGPTEEELQRQKDAELADKMANICQQTLERVQPVCKQITEYMDKADRTPKEELDEEELVNNVKPLIEEAGRILQECNGSLRGLDPDGRIAGQAKGRAGTREATPEEYRLADLLKEITNTVVTTIDNAKKKLQDMPHAKKKLNPLWGLLTEPLFQIIAAVGLLLAGVLGLVGKLLSGLGLGGLVSGLLGGLGIDKLLGGLGLGSIAESLGGGKKKKKGGNAASGLPIVGGMFGGNK